MWIFQRDDFGPTSTGGFCSVPHLMSCGCHTLECHCDEGLHGLAVVSWPGLGFIGIDARAQSAISSSGQAGRIVDAGGASIYVPGTSECAASGISGANRAVGFISSGASLALTGVVQAGLIATGPATLGITIAIAGLTGLFSTLFSHHAAAVKKEQNTLCTAVPAANNYLDIIDQAVSSGAVDAQHALAA